MTIIAKAMSTRVLTTAAVMISAIGGAALMTVPAVAEPASAPVITMSSSIENWGWSARHLVDGQTGSGPESMGWSSAGHDQATASESLSLSWWTPRTADRLRLYPRQDAPAGVISAGFPRDFTVKVLTDGGGWTTVADVRDLAPPAGGTPFVVEFAALNVRSVQIDITELSPVPEGDQLVHRAQFTEVTLDTAGKTSPETGGYCGGVFGQRSLAVNRQPC
ncbi:discoidin domain-containing protein [Lentzea sp. E54]|uniref:discoidin domain-containing protein n=1 Tax=Lentzea xerophila TaxID=3435883 RepID=UPI003DA5AECB